MNKNSLLLATFFGLLSGGCQPIAGVRTDAEFVCKVPEDCPEGVCVDGECVSPSCEKVGDPVEIFSAEDLGMHDINTQNMLRVLQPGGLGVVVHDIVDVANQQSGRLLMRSWNEDSANPLSAIAELDLSAKVGAEFTWASLDENYNLLVHGRWGEEIGHVRFFPAQFSSYPALPVQCTSPNSLNVVLFDRANDVTRYALTCSGRGSATLLIGSEDQEPEIVVEGTSKSEIQSIRDYIYWDTGMQFLPTENALGSPYRSGASAMELAELHELKLSDDPEITTVLLDSVKTPDGKATAMLMGALSDSAAFWGGIVEDYGDLESVPPPVLAEIDAPGMQVFKAFSSLLAASNGYYMATLLTGGKSIQLQWLDSTFQRFLLIDAPVVDLPAEDTGVIVSLSAVATGPPGIAQRVQVIWIELRDGLMSVLGQRMECGYTL